jgi:hypothetical protein
MKRKLVAFFSAIGFVVPLLILLIDWVSGWYPDWVGWIWPSWFLLGPASGHYLDLDKVVIIVISALVNALIYAMFGLLVYSLISLGSRR